LIADDNAADAQLEADSASEDFLSVRTIDVINHSSTSGGAQRNMVKVMAKANTTMKAPQKSMQGLTPFEINQLECEFNSETSQADDEGGEGGEYEEDEEDEGPGDDDCDEDTEAPAAAAAVASDESSEAEAAPPIPEPAKKSKPTKKQQAQALREKVQATRKEPSVKGFQRKVFRFSDR
jgi:hypothetical protein